MQATKEDLWDRFPHVVKDIKGSIDTFVCVFYWMIMEKWANDSRIREQALNLLDHYRPVLAEDIKKKGPLTIAVKGTWHKQSSYLA